MDWMEMKPTLIRVVYDAGDGFHLNFQSKVSVEKAPDGSFHCTLLGQLVLVDPEPFFHSHLYTVIPPRITPSLVTENESHVSPICWSEIMDTL